MRDGHRYVQDGAPVAAVDKKEVKIQKKKLRELFKRERRKAATSNSPITINRDSEVFKKYLETRRKEEEKQENAEEEEEGDFGKRTRRRHPVSRLRNVGWEIFPLRRF